VALTVPTDCLLSSKATFYSTPDREAEYCDERVCVCVCVFVCLFLCDHIFGTTHPIFTMCFVCVLPMAMARSSSGGIMIRYTYIQIYIAPKIVRRCTSCFMDDIIFAHRPRLLDVAPQLKRSAHAALGLAIKCVQ